MQEEITDLSIEPIVGLSVGLEFFSNDEAGEEDDGWYLIIDLIFVRVLVHRIYR